MRHSKWFLLVVSLILMTVVLVGCKEDQKKVDQEKEEASDEKNTDSNIFDVSVTHDGDPIEGGMLKVALVKDEPFQGIFSWELYEDGYDSDLMSYASNSIFEVDGNFMITDEGIASLDVDQEQSKVTVKIRDGVKWSDGEPLKIEDLIYPYLIIGHPDYTGVRYDTSFKNIVGAEEYHAGKTDTISGIQKIDESTLEIQFKQLSPAIFFGGDGLWTYAAPSHQLKDIPVGELVESDEVRKNPVTLGPFKFDKVVPGESVQFVRNEHYWKGSPKLDGVIVKVVPPSSISMAIQSGEYDMALSFSASKIKEIEELDNITILARPELYYSYLGFKLGKFDYENNTVVTDLENAKLGDKALRQAIAYALDIEQVNEVFYHNLRDRANSLIPPVFQSFYDASLEGYTYDPEKAKELLDNAGYKDVDGDGLREDPEGNPFVINLAAMSGDTTQEEVIAFYLQNWKDVGLNVQLTNGRLIEFNSFYDKVEADDPEIDMFMAAWGTGTNPSPLGLYGASDQFNLARYTSDTLETTIRNIDSDEAFDEQYRAEQFRAFQEYMSDVLPVVPMQFRYEIVPINKRVKNYNIDYENGIEYHEIELVAEEPIASE